MNGRLFAIFFIIAFFLFCSSEVICSANSKYRKAKNDAKQKIKNFVQDEFICFGEKKCKKPKKTIVKKKIKKLEPINILFFYDPRDQNFEIDSDENLKVIEQANEKSTIVKMEIETNEFVDVEKK